MLLYKYQHYYTWKNIKKVKQKQQIKNTSSKMEWQILITDYFENIIKKHETLTNNCPIRTM